MLIPNSCKIEQVCGTGDAISLPHLDVNSESRKNSALVASDGCMMVVLTVDGIGDTSGQVNREVFAHARKVERGDGFLRIVAKKKTVSASHHHA